MIWLCFCFPPCLIYPCLGFLVAAACLSISPRECLSTLYSYFVVFICVSCSFWFSQSDPRKSASIYYCDFLVSLLEPFASYGGGYWGRWHWWRRCWYWRCRWKHWCRIHRCVTYSIIYNKIFVDLKCIFVSDCGPAGSHPIVTGNWGCGSSLAGDAQLKSMIQWMAASRSGAPYLIYHTFAASSVVKVTHTPWS